MQYTQTVPSSVAPGSILTCSRCAHKWAIRKKGDLPKNCPKCRSTLWMKNYHVYTCMKCEHSWGTANESPQRCPKCHTSKWNTPNITKSNKESRIVCRLSAEAKAQVYERYDAGETVIAISVATGIAFGDVMDAVLERNPSATARI